LDNNNELRCIDMCGLGVAAVLFSLEPLQTQKDGEECPARHDCSGQQHRRIEERVALHHDVAHGYRWEREWHAVRDVLQKHWHSL
jgi:hypothetical protein